MPIEPKTMWTTDEEGQPVEVAARQSVALRFALDDALRDTPQQLRDERVRHVMDRISIPALPDISQLVGLVTEPPWLSECAGEPGFMLAALIEKMTAIEDLRLLFDRGYFSTDNVRMAWFALAWPLRMS